MKKLNLIILFCLALSTFTQAQIPPQAFNYSAVARNVSGVPIANSTIGIQISILKTSTVGPAQYSENHFVNTDAYGLFNLIIGAGAVQSGSMSTINWSADNYYLKVGMDATGGTNFLTMGTTQLLSVPYALHAATADSIIGGSLGFSGNYNDLTNQPISINSISQNGDTLLLSNGQVFTTINDNDATNELQHLTVSTSGDTLYLSNGNWVIIPGVSAANNSGGGGNGIYTTGNGVNDIDGNTYNSIVINGQEWMSENLRTIRYANGDTIPNVVDPTEWSSLTTGAWALYNNDNQFNNPYGKYYNWFAVADSRNLCPNGWHVPSDAEWTILSDYLGGSNVAGGKMKSIGTQYWQWPNTEATNESGFLGLPGGYRNYFGSFISYGPNGVWWSSTEYDTSSAWYRFLSYDSGVLNNIHDDGKKTGFSVRCIKD